MNLKAVFFDMDGVIINTEKDGHRIAFNEAFEEFKIQAYWDVNEYHKLLQVGGGKERIRHFFDKTGYSNTEYLSDPADYIMQIHMRKTEIFIELIHSRKLPLRPGIRRIMEEINSQNIPLFICTTSNEQSATAVAESMLTNIRIDAILAGDVVKKKKPDPEIYHMAIQKSGLDPASIVVVEDSMIGVQAAKNAGLRVCATVNEYTRNEDVSAADIVVDCLGDPNGVSANILLGNKPDNFHGYMTLSMINELLEELT